MPSQSQRESNGELVADADERTISGVQDERQMVTESMSSVDYFSCCGLGHRLSKMSDAHYVAKKRLNFQLRVFWATCQVASSSVNHNNQTNVEVFTTFLEHNLWKKSKSCYNSNNKLARVTTPSALLLLLVIITI